MLKQITWFPRRPDLDAEAFASHWRTRHAEVVCELPGLRRYVQNHIPDAPPGLDGIAEVWFEDIEAMRANVGHPALERIRADERNFIDVANMDSIVAEPETVIDGAAAGARLLVLVRRNRAVEPAEFHRAWREDVGGAMAALGGGPGAPTRYEQDHVRSGVYRGGREPGIDGTASLWFASREAGAGFFASAGFASVAATERDLMDGAAIRAVWVEPLTIL